MVEWLTINQHAGSFGLATGIVSYFAIDGDSPGIDPVTGFPSLTVTKIGE